MKRRNKPGLDDSKGRNKRSMSFNLINRVMLESVARGP